MTDMDNVPQGDMTPAIESKNFYLAPEPPKKKRKAPLIIGIIAAVALVAALGVGLWWQAKRDTQPPDETTIETEVEMTEQMTEEETTVAVTEEVTTQHVHIEEVLVEIAPTCTETGLTEGKNCADCDEILVHQTVIDALGHTYTSAFIAPTATKNGYTLYTCSDCGDSYNMDTIIPVSFTVTSENRSQIGYTGEDGEDLVIPAVFQEDDTWYRVTSIGDSAFDNCTGLTSVVIPDSVTSIGYDAFSGCFSLISVVIPDSVTSIGTRAFLRCSGLSSAVIPDSVTSISSDTFSYCTGLTSIEIPDSVTSIGGWAFSHCTGLTSIEIPDSVTSIGWSAFSTCTGLTSIEIPDSVTSIGWEAFSWCTGLTSIEIPDSVTSIGEGTFSLCTGLTSIVIPNSVTSIGEGAFSNCSGLTDIYFTGTESEWEAITKGTDWDTNTGSYTIHYNYVPS